MCERSHGCGYRSPELRELASYVARSTHDLGRELEALEMSADALQRQKIDHVKQSGGGPHSGEMGSHSVVGINVRISEATGLAAMERRIQRLRSILEDRESG